MHNQNIKVREGRKEVLVYLDKFYPDELTAIREASKVLQREVIYRETHPDPDTDR